ncbi:hypothetical protein ES703_95965 [subsurface metagenome]
MDIMKDGLMGVNVYSVNRIFSFYHFILIFNQEVKLKIMQNFMGVNPGFKPSVLPA